MYSLIDIFEEIEKVIEEGHPPISTYISYLEIYNEQINDLLNPGSDNLKIIED
jgi:hypothetical protein